MELPTRTEALFRVLGWSGGTIHQAAAYTGCSVESLLYSPEPNEIDCGLGSDHCAGWFAARTCSNELNIDKNFPPKHGNLMFWLGAIHGMQMKMKGM